MVYLQVIRGTQVHLDNLGVRDVMDLLGLNVASVDRQAFLGCAVCLVHVGSVGQRELWDSQVIMVIR